MDTPKTRYDLTKNGLEAFNAYFESRRILKENYPAILEEKGLTHRASAYNVLLQLLKGDHKIEAVDDGALQCQIIATLQRLVKTLEELKEQLEQAQLQKSIEMDGWEKVSNCKPDLMEKDKRIRKDIKNLDLCAKMLFPATKTKQSDSSTSSGEIRAR
jgi:hypothetical protein